MKVKVSMIIAANAALQMMEVAGGVPYKIVRQIQKLKIALGNEIRLAEDQIQKRMLDLGGVPEENGVIQFPTRSRREEFDKAWEDILHTDVEIDADMVDLKPYANKIIFQNLNADVDALSAFIDFGDD